ncbi:CAP domain-containing protein [Patescibacteria group bacterium]|nr:MAG: CAP domain-containing protein [Patescibacteria group bacterium]
MTIHHWFIPNKKNRFHPIALRPVGLMVFLAIFVTIPFLYNVTSAKQAQVLGYATDVSVGDINALSNQQRVDNGLPALNLDSQLVSAAQAKAADMFADDYWAHIAPDGLTPWSFIYGAGYNYGSAGENLAKDFNTSAGVVNAWMASSEHRANILNTNYQDAGYAVVNGVLLGSETTLVVAMYGVRATPVQTAPAAAPTSPKAVTSPSPTATPTVSTPAPATTPTPSPTPTPTTQEPAQTNSAPSPTTTTTTQVTTTPPVEEAASSDINGLVQGIATSAPVRAYTTLNWGQKASILLLLALILLFIMKHTLIWRAQRRGIRHIWLRAHPIGQIAVLSTVLVLTLLSGVGTIL